MSFIEKLSTYQLDTLKEIGNIGAGNAATALSKLLNRKIEMQTPSVRIASFDETMEIVGGAEKVIVSVFLRIEGEAPGSMFYLLSPEQAERFVHHITGSDDFSFANPPYPEMGLSILHEIGNILSGSYLTALSDFTQLNMQPSVPSLSMDMAGAIISEGLIELSRESDYAIIIDTMIQVPESETEEIEGHFFLLPDPESFEKIFTVLGVNDQ
ncbi:chemotaxis protein CheC [Virgibacillus senegalensis]|uniref:chemotaxis protein CheC n=1 Tax=Virgibacillus senegalensis TaxID=1499679 RepID=UPI00069DB66F|nr:chemotaxis protein CheC [Virgibacillus senegalensis]